MNIMTLVLINVYLETVILHHSMHYTSVTTTSTTILSKKPHEYQQLVNCFDIVLGKLQLAQL